VRPGLTEVPPLVKRSSVGGLLVSVACGMAAGRGGAAGRKALPRTPTEAEAVEREAFAWPVSSPQGW